jgi:cyclophilin family peptidyl-prolyl cis-trans isomerase
MANPGDRNANGSQFFITYAALPNLNNLHTIFGQVTTGLGVANGLTRSTPGSGITPDVIRRVTIVVS